MVDECETARDDLPYEPAINDDPSLKHDEVWFLGDIMSIATRFRILPCVYRNFKRLTSREGLDK
jgi:hypothetical protein